jgi:hypothetical protein
MELIIEVTLQLEQDEDEDTHYDEFRQEGKDKVIETLSPLLQEGWKVTLTGSRVNR